MTMRGRSYGLTIVELLLALAGTAFVSVAIVAMLSAVASGTNSRTDLRSSVVRQKTVTARLSAAIRSSQMVLVADDDLLVLWINDNDANGEPNLAEIQRVERDAATGELCAYKAPLTLAEEDNTEYTLATDFDSVTNAIKSTGTFPREVWATGLHSWNVTFNADSPQDATLVSSRISIGEGNMRETVICAAALRNNGSTSFSSSSGELITSDESDEGDANAQSGSNDNSSDDEVILNNDDDDDSGKGKSKSKAEYDDDDDDDKGKGKGKDDDDDDKGKGKGKGKGK
jgi:hypothetical protein